MKIVSEYSNQGLSIILAILPIYDSKICYVKYDTREEYDEALSFCEKMGLNTEEYRGADYFDAFGFTFKDKTNKGNIHFLFMNDREDYKPDFNNTLSHENYHLITNICRHHGLDVNDTGDNEHIAYLTGYIFDQLMQFTDRMNKSKE